MVFTQINFEFKFKFSVVPFYPGPTYVYNHLHLQFGEQINSTVGTKIKTHRFVYT